MPPRPDGAWARAGELLSQRRVEIDPRYRNRRLFAAERGMNWRLLHDLERAKRTNFEPETLTAFEVAYCLVRGSFMRTLDAGELEPLPGSDVHPGPGPKGPPPTDTAEVKRIAAAILDMADASERANGRPATGDDLFPATTKQAEWERAVWADEELPVARRARMIAEARLMRAAARTHRNDQTALCRS
jgi:hypothetical protein